MGVLGLLLVAVLLVCLIVWMMAERRTGVQRATEQVTHAAFRPAVAVDVDTSSLLVGVPSQAGAPHILVLDTETMHAISREGNHGVEGEPSPVVALSWQRLDARGGLIDECSYLLRQAGEIAPEATEIHGITTEMMRAGEEPAEIYERLRTALGSGVQVIAAHNLAFHLSTLRADMVDRWGLAPLDVSSLECLCTMECGRALRVKIVQGESQYPSLSELFGWCYFGRLNINLRYSSKGKRDIRLVSACVRALGLGLDQD